MLNKNPELYIQKLKLINFRNYLNTTLETSQQPVVLIGDNGVGKTNVLESISLLSKGRGFKNVRMDIMQNHNTQSPLSINYQINRNNELFSINITNFNNKRHLLIDNKIQSYFTVHSIACIIWLIPQLDHIFLKSPSERLKFFDRIVHIFDMNYASYIIQYEKARRERSKVLHMSPQDNNWLFSLENIIAINGINIAKVRLKVLKILQKILAENKISSAFLKSSINIHSQIFEILDQEFDNAIEIYKERLKENRKKDLMQNCVSFGVHNDNFQVLHSAKNLIANNCSTGEQKILLLSLILSAVIAKYEIYGQSCIILLDDIMSHLDATYRNNLLLTILDMGCQTWITDINIQNFIDYKKYFQFFYISNNNIRHQH
ncbi:DNA replication/repair protein RecF [Neoehrlichia mikurensis]|uniref:DNA replication and repair protein RecF n=1 Tax=Neoehrlichia mikurensis TaxID=89586 RepID=A0A9Q9BTS7_9RICK|nr:DNA replication/repair protein RecF [Neoehrlichia mikurensis]QXK92285.1 DNA replication/repair protein RecF [Neoehrlichia mikurensis]QXK92739.1 DNA replication/repair protein RecF [Neoehrlichia mikurensis]QXK93980.1 DNA replication/repair protein RecF [Neoehrlichia mikurensis]UTO55857.1 DNA replication/repair protein RecF [Neoehrlichia mikurensis]UTO56772.1 DNA replication/repair protein RecF [Neoehrlichia mikurensis]